MGSGLAIHAGCVLTPEKQFSPGLVLVQDGKIAAVGLPDAVDVGDDFEVLEVPERTVVPGFVDTHVHGRDGHNFGETVEITTRLCESIARTGTTSLLPTIVAQPTLEGFLERIRNVRAAMKSGIDGSEIIGIHLEGPYLSGQDIARGSQPAVHFRKPALEELHKMVEASEGTIRKMAIAPELEGAIDVIRELANLGIVASGGHTAATYEQTLEAIEAGLNCATHTFNGMLPFHHRNPGFLGAVLMSEEISAELIADGAHVSAVAIQLLIKCKGLERIHLVTDNTTYAGLPNGKYKEPERNRTVVKEEGRAYVLGGTLTGSVSPMNLCLRNMTENIGLSLREALRLATIIPARVIGMEDRKGSLEAGKDADLVVIDDDLNVEITMVRGKVVYRKSE